MSPPGVSSCLPTQARRARPPWRPATAAPDSRQADMESLPPSDEVSATRVDGRARRSTRPLEPSARFSVADTQLVPGAVEEVIDRDIHRRMVAFAPFVMVLIGIVGLSSFALGGDLLARSVMLGSMVACFAVALWMLRRLRTHAHVTNR